MTDEETEKRIAAEDAIRYIRHGTIVGVGTGSTVAHFIRALGTVRDTIEGAVASSEATRKMLEQHNIPVFDLNDVGTLGTYVDGADEVDQQLCLLKGGGGALTREKIIAEASVYFICIADSSKVVDKLGTTCPLPIEVIPTARSLVMRKLESYGGKPELREGFVTDNGNQIIDVRGLNIACPPSDTEEQLNQIPGVVAVGLFARRNADLLVVGIGDQSSAIPGL